MRAAEGPPGLTVRDPSVQPDGTELHIAKESSLKLCGFEPSDTLTNSFWYVVELSQSVPNFVESGLGPGKFFLRDGEVYAAVLQHITSHS